LLPADWARRPAAASGDCARPHEIAGGTKQVAIDWTFDFAAEFDEFLDEVRALQAKQGDLRMVYAFY
jgi:hypothetical protein